MLLNFSLKQKKLTLSYTIYFYYYYTKKIKEKWKEKRLEEILRESESYKYSNKPMIWDFLTCFIFLIGIRFTWSLRVNMIYISLPTFSKQKLAFSTRNLSCQLLWGAKWTLISPRASLQFSTKCFFRSYYWLMEC